jgi:hypothetical protein
VNAGGTESLAQPFDFLLSNICPIIRLDKVYLPSKKKKIIFYSFSMGIGFEIMGERKVSTWKGVWINLKFLSDVRTTNLTLRRPIQHFMVPTIQETRND